MKHFHEHCSTKRCKTSSNCNIRCVDPIVTRNSLYQQGPRRPLRHLLRRQISLDVDIMALTIIVYAIRRIVHRMWPIMVQIVKIYIKRNHLHRRHKSLVIELEAVLDELPARRRLSMRRWSCHAPNSLSRTSISLVFLVTSATSRATFCSKTRRFSDSSRSFRRRSRSCFSFDHFFASVASTLSMSTVVGERFRCRYRCKWRQDEIKISSSSSLSKHTKMSYTDCPPKNYNRTFSFNNFQNYEHESKYALGFWNYN